MEEKSVRNQQVTREEVLAFAQAFERKSFSKWFLYSIVLVFPTVLAIFTLVSLYTAKEIPEVPKGLPEYIQQAIPFFFLFIIIECIVARFQRKEIFRFNDGVNSIFMGVFQQVTDVFWKWLGVVPYNYIHTNYCFFDWTDRKPNWLDWLFMFLLVEFGYYWLHRFAHELNPLWAGHVVHHSSEEYNLTTALRQGFLQPVYSWVFYLPIAFLFPVPLFVFHLQFNTLYQFWIHTKIIGKLGPLEWLFNTPSHHRVHHGRNGKYIDKNYGGTLIIFDRIFGTFEPEQEEPEYGITFELQAWNPFFLQTHHWYQMWNAATKIPGIWNKIRVFVDYGPSFNWRVLYYEEASKESRTKKFRLKYDSNVPNIAMSIYVFIHSLFILVHAVTVLLTNKKHDMFWRILHVSYILWSLFAISSLFEQKHWARRVESIRLLVSSTIAMNLMGYGYFYFFYISWVMLASDITVVILHVAQVISIIWIWIYQGEPHKIKES